MKSPPAHTRTYRTLAIIMFYWPNEFQTIVLVPQPSPLLLAQEKNSLVRLSWLCTAACEFQPWAICENILRIGCTPDVDLRGQVILQVVRYQFNSVRWTLFSQRAYSRSFNAITLLILGIDRTKTCIWFDRFFFFFFFRVGLPVMAANQ